MDGLATRVTAEREAELAWTVHPASDKPGLAVAVGALIAVAALLAARVGGSPGFAVMALVLLGGSLRGVFLPVSYGLDALGAWEQGALRRTTVIAWADVRRIGRHPGGLYLSERLVDSRWLAPKGLFLRTGGRRAEVQAFVEAHVPAP